jgi:hypothetical protein
MPLRTLTEARVALDEMAPRLSDYWTDVYKQVLTAYENKAQQAAADQVALQEQEARELHRDALQDLTAARDAYEEVARESGTGRVSAEDLSKRLYAARAQQAKAEHVLAQVADIADQVERIEQDPLAWFSDLQSRMPRLRTETPW